MSKSDTLGMLLGIAISSGIATKIRLWNYIGISEILFLILAIYTFALSRSYILRYTLSLHGFLKFVIFVYIFLIAPITTFINSFFLIYNKPTPIYMFAFAMGYILLFGIVFLLKKNKINMEYATVFSAYIFIFIALMSVVFFKDISFYGTIRFTALAKNPNQLALYSMLISFLLTVYTNGIKRLLLLVIIVLIGLASRSDAYILAVLITCVSFFMLKFMSGNIYRVLSGVVILTCVFFYGMYHIDDIVNLWYGADEGGGRLWLYINSLYVTFMSPVLGFGVGSFSGITAPFQGSEAHNTFLDLSMQFGIIFALAIYAIMLSFILKTLKQGKFLETSFAIGILILTMFHFFARHFAFWVILAVMFYYAFVDKKTYVQNNWHFDYK